MSGNVSTGRGGAGNIGNSKSTPKDASADTLNTPTIKGSTYTTGRGGSGNMAKNDPDRPEVARAAQDVSAPPERQEKYGEGVHHGRGGAANVYKQGEKGQQSRRREDGTWVDGKEGRTAEESAIAEGTPTVAGGQKKGERSGSRVMDAAKEGIAKLRRGSGTEKK